VDLVLRVVGAAVGFTVKHKATPDETVNRTARVLFAEFRSFVGTMWGVADEDRPVIVAAFSDHMLRIGPEAIDCRNAAQSLLIGVKELRRRNVPLER